MEAGGPHYHKNKDLKELYDRFIGKWNPFSVEKSLSSFFKFTQRQQTLSSPLSSEGSIYL